MSTVTWVEKKGDKAAILVMSDDTRVWTPDKALADTLVGKSIPDDWTTKQGEYGPQAFPPRAQKGGGGFAAAYRNTEAGFAKEQQRMDARTAVMQATVEGVFIKDTADEIYQWLREASGAVLETSVGESDRGRDIATQQAPRGSVGNTSGASEPGLPPTTPSVIAPAIDGEVEGVGSLGEGAPAPETIHIHDWKPAPREGWLVCKDPTCLKAEMASKAKV